MDSLNRMAVELVDEAIDFAEDMNVGVYDLDNDARVLDFGIDFRGGLDAGRMLAEIQTAMLARVDTRMGDVAGAPIPHVELTTEHPALALLCSQKAGWEITEGDFEGLGSGPARALVGMETVFQEVGYHDAFEFAVLAVETDQVPDEAVARQVAEQAEVNESGVFLVAFPTASVAGSVSVAARAPELAVYRLHELGYDVGGVISASGTAPVAPVAGDEATAMARTNDTLAYGGRVHLVVEEDFDEFDQVVSSAADEYGRPFGEIFDGVDWEFESVPRGLFAPAQVTVDVEGGPTHVFGETDEDLLAESFGI